MYLIHILFSDGVWAKRPSFETPTGCRKEENWTDGSGLRFKTGWFALSSLHPAPNSQTLVYRFQDVFQYVCQIRFLELSNPQTSIYGALDWRKGKRTRKQTEHGFRSGWLHSIPAVIMSSWKRGTVMNSVWLLSVHISSWHLPIPY